MDDVDAQPNIDDRDRAQRRLIRVAGAGSLWCATALGNISRLFVLSLGGSAFDVALLETLTQTTPLGQLAGLKLLPRLGKTRLMAVGKAAAVAPMLAVVALAAFGFTGPPTVAATIACFFVMLLLNAIGNTSWWPLLQDNTSSDAMGAFFARMRTRLRVIDVAAPLAVGAYLGASPAPRQFVLPFVVGAMALAAGGWMIRRVGQGSYQPPDVSLLLRLRLAGRSASIRRYLWFVLQHTFIIALAAPFWVVILKDRNMPSGYVVWLGTIAALGHLAGLRLWAWMVDTHGGRAVLTLSSLGTAALGGAWLLLPDGQTPMMVWGAAFFLLWGFLEGGILMGRTWTMMIAVPAVYQADGLTLGIISMAAGGSLGSLLGGAAFTYFESCPRLLGHDATAVYLAAAQCLVVLTFVSSRRLRGHGDQTPTRQLLAGFWRRTMETFRPDMEG